LRFLRGTNARRKSCSRSAKFGETIAKPTVEHNKNVLFLDQAGGLSAARISKEDIREWAVFGIEAQKLPEVVGTIHWST
jgi:hypothetical protein